MSTPEERVNQARAAYTAAMSRQEANEARHAEANQALVEAEAAIADCDLIETSLAEAVATTAQEYLQATRDANNVAVKAIDDERPSLSGPVTTQAPQVDSWNPKTWAPSTLQKSALDIAADAQRDARELTGIDDPDPYGTADAQIDRDSAHEALRAVERVIPADSIK